MLLVVGVSVLILCGFATYMMLRRRVRSALGPPEDSWDAPAALSKEDVGKRMSVDGDAIIIDGKQRRVLWQANRVVDASRGESKIKMVNFARAGATDVEIIGVTGPVGSPVMLAGGVTFDNPVSAAEVGYERLAAVLAPSRDSQQPIRLVRDEFFIQQSKQGAANYQRSFIPAEYFFDGRLDDPLLHIIAISCPVYAPGNADLESSMQLDAFHISMIGALLAARAARVRPGRSLDLAPVRPALRPIALAPPRL